MKAVNVLICLGLAAACATANAQEPDGRRLFVNHCAACHGPLGEADGPVATSLTIRVPMLRTLAQRNGGVFPEAGVRAYIDGREPRAAHGDRQMPIWGDVFSAIEPGGQAAVAARINAIVAFIAELQYR